MGMLHFNGDVTFGEDWASQLILESYQKSFAAEDSNQVFVKLPSLHFVRIVVCMSIGVNHQRDIMSENVDFLFWTVPLFQE